MSAIDRENILTTGKLSAPEPFMLKPEAEARAALASDLGIRGIRKLTFSGEIAPSGARDLKLAAKLGATVVQDCVVTGDPVTTRIDETVTRSYLADFVEPDAEEAEMPDDDSAEALPQSLNLADVMAEALALALPPWPRAEGVEPVDITVTEPGKTPMTDEDTKPFAGLKSLRDGLAGGDTGKS